MKNSISIAIWEKKGRRVPGNSREREFLLMAGTGGTAFALLPLFFAPFLLPYGTLKENFHGIPLYPALS